jgi:hypothetical protein
LDDDDDWKFNEGYFWEFHVLEFGMLVQACLWWRAGTDSPRTSSPSTANNRETSTNFTYFY